MWPCGLLWNEITTYRVLCHLFDTPKYLYIYFDTLYKSAFVFLPGLWCHYPYTECQWLDTDVGKQQNGPNIEYSFELWSFNLIFCMLHEHPNMYKKAPANWLQKSMWRQKLRTYKFTNKRLIGLLGTVTQVWTQIQIQAMHLKSNSEDRIIYLGNFYFI